MLTIDKLSSLKGKDCLSLADYTPEEVLQLIEFGIALKQKSLTGERPELLKGKVLGMIFEKNSTRTRVSFESGMLQLGGHAMYMNGHDLQLGRGETVHDTAKVLNQYVDALMIRTFEHSKVEELAEYATVPVINGLTDMDHPCQALADLMTIYEEKGTFNGVKLVYVGDGNNVAHALMLGAAQVGIEMVVSCPKQYEPSKLVVEQTKAIAAKTGGSFAIVHDPIEAVQGADFIYTDVWTSMGYEEESALRLEAFAPYQVNDELMSHAANDFGFLHCLPAIRGQEVTESIIDGPHSLVFPQAGNRLHAQKALLVALLSD